MDIKLFKCTKYTHLSAHRSRTHLATLAHPILHRAFLPASVPHPLFRSHYWLSSRGKTSRFLHPLSSRHLDLSLCFPPLSTFLAAFTSCSSPNCITTSLDDLLTIFLHRPLHHIPHRWLDHPVSCTFAMPRLPRDTCQVLDFPRTDHGSKVFVPLILDTTLSMWRRQLFISEGSGYHSNIDALVNYGRDPPLGQRVKKFRR